MIRCAVPHLRQTPVDDVQEVNYYHTCKSLLNLLTSRTAVGLRQEVDCMFQVFGPCHSFQLIQWEEVPCDCWLCVWSHFPSKGWPALHSNKKRWMHGIFGRRLRHFLHRFPNLCELNPCLPGLMVVEESHFTSGRRRCTPSQAGLSLASPNDQAVICTMLGEQVSSKAKHWSTTFRA